jgi:lysozyme family protein
MIDTWLERVFGHEGGYSNRTPIDDPGGETKWGISKKSYPWLDIKSLTKDEAVDIYKNDFLEPILKENLSDGVAYQLLDFGIHSGINRAVKELQKVLNVKADGLIGPDTQEALSKYSESDLIMLILSARMFYLVNLNNWQTNSRGWVRRIARNLYYGIEDSD